ncbi:MAG: hypothetical protein JSS32_00410 [Verrucomicrobia bacterium]|nr:hypothetical protein [Verrucomicrobiota bacterium]
MTTANSIQTYLSTGRLVYVDPNSNLRVVSLGGYFIRWLKSLCVGKEAAFADCKSERVALAVERYLGQRGLPSFSRWNGVDFLRRLSQKVRRVEVRTDLQAKANRAAQIALAPKRNLVDRAILSMRNAPEGSIAYRDALTFLEERRARIVRGERTPLPHWFHATPNGQGVRSILGSATIYQNHAVRGYGAYVSSADEAGQIIGYGRYSFALDEDFIDDKRAFYFVPNPENSIGNWIYNRIAGWKCPSIWARVESHLPVHENSVAYICYPKEEEGARLNERNSIRRAHPWVRFMNRETSEKIYDVFRTVSTRIIPESWRRMRGLPRNDLPPHFRERVS